MSFKEACKAVSEGNIEALRQMDLCSFINDSIEDEEEEDEDDYKTLLETACGKGYLEIVKLLLNVDGVDVNKNGPLVEACRSGHLEIVKLLLNTNGVDVNLFGPLATACYSGNLEIVKLLLNVDGVDVNKDRPLKWACRNGHLEIVKSLLAKNVEIGEIERTEYDKKIKPKFNLAWSLDELKDFILSIITDPTINITHNSNIMQSRVQEYNEEMLEVKLRQISEQEDTIRTLCEKIEGLENQLKEATRIPSVKQVVRIPKLSQTIHSLKKELNGLENQIKEITNCGKDIEFKKLNELVEERNRIGNEIIDKYTLKLNQFENEKKDLFSDIERMEDSIRENATNLECFQNVNKLKLKKKDLLKSLATIKDDIDDIDLEKDELVVQIKKHRKNKIGTNEEIERLEKKLSEMGRKISELNEQKTEIEQNLMELISTLPEIIVEMEQPLTADGIIMSLIDTPEEKFKLFARQNSILLLNNQLADYPNLQELHTGLSVVYKATKSNNQMVILKESPLTASNYETVMNEIMNIVRLKGHSRIIKLNGVFIESRKVYIETPYYSNSTLLEYIKKIRNHHDLPTLKTILRSLFRKITETLQFIHSKDILHRDLKPHNILINEHGEPIIADFGSSKRLIAQLTNNTMEVGTLKYLAIEVKRQEEAPSEKSDIWSLGVSLYECWQLIQQTNMTENATVEILNFDLNGNVKLPIENQQDEIDILLMKMLSHMFEINPRDRPTVLSLLTDEDYFTHENSISVDILSKANQKIDSSDKLSLWQVRLKKLKELVLMLSEHRRGEVKFEINRQNLLQGISEIIDKKMTENNKYFIFYKTFVKYKGETGIDQGGLSNELYSKYLESMLMESKHFQKSETSSNENFILTDEPLTDESQIQLRTFGWLLKKLLIDCDDKTVYLPLNSFIFYYLLNGDVLFKKEPLHLNSITLILSKFLREYDFELDNQIFSMSKCKNDEELQSVTMEETFIDVLSKSEKPLIMQNVQLFIISQLYSYFYSDLKIEKLKLIKQGFDWFNLHEFKQTIPSLNNELSDYDSETDENKSETAISKLSDFVKLQGSNFDEKCLSVNELKILLSGQSYIDADLLLNEINFDDISETMQDHLTKCIRKLTKSQLRQLLVWMTALSSIPIRGFSRKITIREYNRFESHTCSFVFDIPSQLTNFEQFETLFMNCLKLSSVATMEDQ